MRRRQKMQSGKTHIDAHVLYLVEEPGVEEKLVLELATEIERTKDPDYCVVSWASQEEACALFNKLGFVECLDYMLKLQGENSAKLGAAQRGVSVTAYSSEEE